MPKIEMTKGGARAYALVFGLLLLYNEQYKVGLILLGVSLLSILVDKKKDW